MVDDGSGQAQVFADDAAAVALLRLAPSEVDSLRALAMDHGGGHLVYFRHDGDAGSLSFAQRSVAGGPRLSSAARVLELFSGFRALEGRRRTVLYFQQFYRRPAQGGSGKRAGDSGGGGGGGGSAGGGGGCAHSGSAALAGSLDALDNGGYEPPDEGADHDSGASARLPKVPGASSARLGAAAGTGRLTLSAPKLCLRVMSARDLQPGEEAAFLARELLQSRSASAAEPR